MGVVGDAVAEAAGGDQEKVYGSASWLSMAQHAISWLDDQTNARVRGIVHTPTERHPDLLAVILFSSVARHDERSLTRLDPSDVDLLAVFDTDDKHVATNQGYGVTRWRGLEEERHLERVWGSLKRYVASNPQRDQTAALP